MEASKETWQEKAREVLRFAIATYGQLNQLNQVQEELAELVVSISHFRRERVDENKVIGEVADVEIMLEQLKLILGPETEKRLHTARAAKLRRLEYRIACKDSAQRSK